MAISTGHKKIKTAVFISGTGSNLKNLIKFSKLKISPISINLVISNNHYSKGLRFTKIFKIRKYVLDFKKKTLAEKKLLKIMKKNKIELICLAGFMQILSKSFIKRSLLPKYKGLNTHKRALINKDKYSGCTVHYVTEKLDSGKIIIQKKVKINRKDTPKTLAKKILIQEHKIYPKAILKIFNI